MSPTLEEIKFEHSKLAVMIAAFEHQAESYLPEGVTLDAGEKYICSIIRPDGKITHTILLPGDSDGVSWADQMEWAKSIGGDLPSRAYWSNTQLSGHSDSAWCQNFSYGSQYGNGKNNELRARAVRQIISNSAI
jgi:hypothetical protein